MSGWRIKNNVIRIVEILDVKPENPNVKTIFFRDDLCSSAEPGQFIMVWIPGIDEIPLSLSSARSDGFSSITVAEVGEATRALNSLKAGDLIGVRGPFGIGFKLIGEKALIIGGGTGMAPLMLLINKLVENNFEITVVEGAKSKDNLVFLNSLKRLSESKRIEVFFTTEDGSYGVKGLTTDLAESLLQRKKFDAFYACGPEKMIRRAYELANLYSTDFQASLERYMRCAIGICGSCALGKYRVCRDGPVFKMEEIREIEKYLGKYRYDEKGRRIPIC